MSEDFLAEVQTEDIKITNDDDLMGLLGGQENETPAESLPEENSEEETTEEEEASEEEEATEEVEEPTEGEEEQEEEKEPEKDLKDVPFHEHPRWKKREEDWNKRMEEQKQEFEKKIQEAIPAPKQEEEQEDIDPMFSRLFGEDQEAYKAYQEFRQKEKQEAYEYTKAQFTAEREQQATQEKQWTDWVDGEVNKLTASGKTFDKNELLKVALDFKPTDDKGQISLEKAYTILKNIPKKNNDVVAKKKKVASRSTSSTTGNTKISSTPSTKDVRNRDWHDF